MKRTYVVIGVGLSVLSLAYIGFFFVPFLRFIPIVVLGFGLLFGVIASIFKAQIDKFFNYRMDLLHEKINYIVVDGKEIFGGSAIVHLKQSIQSSQQPLFALVVLSIAYSVTGFVTASLEGIVFWVVLSIVILLNLWLLPGFVGALIGETNIFTKDFSRF